MSRQQLEKENMHHQIQCKRLKISVAQVNERKSSILKKVNVNKKSKSGRKNKRRKASWKTEATTANQNKPTYNCTQCPKTFKTKQGLTKHLPKHANNNKRKQQPEESSFSCKRRRVTGQHQCSYCPEPGFKRHLALATHIGMKHPQQSSKKCQHCGQSFRHPNKLKAHKQDKHWHPPREEFICKICKQQCENYQGLKTYIGMMHQQHVKPFDPNFDFTTAAEFPSWKSITENRTKSIDYNAAAFLKMIGPNLADPRQRPQNMNLNINKDEMLSQWKKCMDHKISIGVCATCGSQVIKADDEFKVMKITNKLPQCFKADNNTLPNKNLIKYKCLHIIEFNNGLDVFKLCDKGVKGDQVTVCKLCLGKLIHAKKNQKPPTHTIAHYDLCKIPINLCPIQDLTLGEKLAMSKVIVHVPLIQLKPVYGPGNAGIKGHSFGIKSTQDEIERSIVQILPRHDLDEVIHVSLVAEKEMIPIAKKILKQAGGALDIRAHVIIPWLQWLKEMGNPHFQNVTILSVPAAAKMLNESVNKILQNACESSSAIIHKMMGKSRAEQDDQDTGLNKYGNAMDSNSSLSRYSLINSE